MSLFVTNDPGAWRQATYACNGVNGGIIYAFRKVAPTATIKCPQSLSPSSGAVISSLSIVFNKGNETTTVEYNLNKFLECEQKDIALFGDTRNNTGSRSIKTGITTSFAGDRQEALEWAVYHHLVGFDHVWIYVNEPWEDGKDIPSLDFVTFIPFNNRVQDFMYRKNNTIGVFNLPVTEVFRVASQNDALWRAKRLGLDWMAFPDLDELVVVGKSTYSNHLSSGPLKTYLANFKATHGDKYYGLLLRSVPYGKNIENETRPELLIDYTWRQDRNLTTDIFRARRKVIVDVHKVNTVNIHYHGHGRLFIPESPEELCINHYKKKDAGVYNTFNGWLSGRAIIEDTRLRDEYRHRIVERLASIREGRP
jgi:hypothetical protein